MTSRQKRVLPAVAGCAACIAALVSLMFVAYYDAGAQRLDATALHGFNTLEAGVLRFPVWGFAIFGGVFPLALGLFFIYYLAVRWDRRREAIAGIVVVLAANATAQILKVVLAHPRIQPVLGDNQVNAGSFPSGHATSAMSMAIAALLVAPPRWRAITAAVGAAFVFAVSCSVLVLVWHFPSDVLGGILVATGYGFAALAVLRYTERRPRERRTIAFAPGPPPTRVIEAGAIAVVFAAAVLGVAWASKISDYASNYTSTLLVGMAISLTAAALLTVFSLTAADDL